MKFLAPLALAATLATPALADLTEMTDAEREVFRSEVRAYLLDNPEVLMEAIAVLEQREASAEVERDQMAVAANGDALFNSAFDVISGNPEGDVTIVEFFDYRCGYCRRVHPEVEALIEMDGNIRYIAKEFPILGDQSLLASRFAIATRIAHGDDAYETMSDALINMRGDVTEAALIALAEENGLSSQEIVAAIDDPLVNSTISYNHALAGRLNITGTPTFVFGDQLVRGAVGIDDMQRIVQMVRAEAE